MTSSRLRFLSDVTQGTGFLLMASNLLWDLDCQRVFHLFNINERKWFLKSEAGKGRLSVIEGKVVAILAA